MMGGLYMSSHVPSNNNPNVQKSGYTNKSLNSGHTAVKHSAVNNPVPGKGGNRSGKGGKK